MNRYADHMALLARLYGKDRAEQWRRIARGMLGDPECRAEYEQWQRDQGKRTNGGSSKRKS